MTGSARGADVTKHENLTFPAVVAGMPIPADSTLDRQANHLRNLSASVLFSFDELVRHPSFSPYGTQGCCPNPDRISARVKRDFFGQIHAFPQVCRCAQHS